MSSLPQVSRLAAGLSELPAGPIGLSNHLCFVWVLLLLSRVSCCRQARAQTEEGGARSRFEKCFKEEVMALCDGLPATPTRQSRHHRCTHARRLTHHSSRPASQTSRVRLLKTDRETTTTDREGLFRVPT